MAVVNGGGGTINTAQLAAQQEAARQAAAQQAQSHAVTFRQAEGYFCRPSKAAQSPGDLHGSLNDGVAA
jgi:hypothetical protein